MNKLTVLSKVIFALISIHSLSCTGTTDEHHVNLTDSSVDELRYDSLLAAKLGADDYGMHQYVMAFLLTGDSVNIDSARRVELSQGHMANIRKMGESGALVLAGPFLDGGKFRGIYIFDVKTIEEAEELTKTDPAVQAGVFKFEMHPWYGSAGLKQVSEIGERIRKTSF